VRWLVVCWQLASSRWCSLLVAAWALIWPCCSSSWPHVAWNRSIWWYRWHLLPRLTPTSRTLRSSIRTCPAIWTSSYISSSWSITSTISTATSASSCSRAKRPWLSYTSLQLFDALNSLLQFVLELLHSHPLLGLIHGCLVNFISRPFNLLLLLFDDCILALLLFLESLRQTFKLDLQFIRVWFGNTESRYMWKPEVAIFVALDFIPEFCELHFFVLDIFCKLLNLILCCGPIIVIFGFCVVFFLIELQKLLLLVCKIALNFVHFLSHFFILLLNFEEILYSIMTINVIFRLCLEILSIKWLRIENCLWSIHL